MPPHPGPESPDLTPHQRLAAALEKAFARHRRSLTDEATALDYRITLGEVRTLLTGALQQGILDEDQHQTLDAMLEGMMAAPGLLA